MPLARKPAVVRQKEYFWRLIDVARAVSSAKDIDALCKGILTEAQSVSNADGGSILLLKGVGIEAHLEFILIKNETLGVDKKELSELETFSNIPLYDAAGKPNDNNISSYCALNNKTVNIADAYNTDVFDFSGTKEFDRRNKYHTQSVLTVALRNHDREVIGILQLINPRDVVTGEVKTFHPEVQMVVEALSSLVSISLQNQMLLREHRDLLVRLSSEPTTISLFERIIREAQNITCAEGGTLYLVDGEDEKSCLEFAVVNNDVLDIQGRGSIEGETDLQPLRLYRQNGSENLSNVATYSALKKCTVNIADAYETDKFDFTGTKEFDREYKYHSKSFLNVPLKNHDDEVIGVLQLVNARNSLTREVIAFSPMLEAIIEALSAYAAVSLNNQILLADHKALLDAFVKCIAQAIDAKSAHTSAHCQRVPALVLALAEASCRDTEGALKDFDLNDDGWYELQVAAWMHDCGKLTTPDSVLNKATKLQVIRDGIESIQLRLQVLQQQKEIVCLRMRPATAWDTIYIAMQYYIEVSQLQSDSAFLVKANKGGEFMKPEDQERVQSIGEIQWLNEGGSLEPVLSAEETAFLCIKRGTLSSEERESINNHIVVTIDMLATLPFPKLLKRVPEYAGGHHERMDGKGYPLGLTGDQMSWPARMMAIADIFEALTAPERPYKDPMPISQALSILQRMRDDNHIDPDLYHVFLKQEVWKQYAIDHLAKEQLDITDYSQYQ